MRRTIEKAREINFRYCWDKSKQHLWPIANRHVYRLDAMYRGKSWQDVETVEETLAYTAKNFFWM